MTSKSDDEMELSEMTHDHPKEVADTVLNRLHNVLTEDNGYDSTNDLLRFANANAVGLLFGIKEQRITKGQPQLSSFLQQVSDCLPDESQKHKMAHIIKHCASYGLTAEGQDLSSPYRGHSHASTVRKT